MQAKQKHVDCLTTLFDKTGQMDDFVDFLIKERIISNSTFATGERKIDRINIMYKEMIKAVDEEKILLLTFDWKLLPTHQIKVSILTKNGSRDFLYGY